MCPLTTLNAASKNTNDNNSTWRSIKNWQGLFLLRYFFTKEFEYNKVDHLMIYFRVCCSFTTAWFSDQTIVVFFMLGIQMFNTSQKKPSCDIRYVHYGNTELWGTSHPCHLLLQHQKTHVSTCLHFPSEFHHSSMRPFRLVNFQQKKHSTMTSSLIVHTKPTTDARQRTLKMHSMVKITHTSSTKRSTGANIVCWVSNTSALNTKILYVFSLRIAFNVFERALFNPDRWRRAIIFHETG